MELISRDEALKQIDEAFDMGDCNCDRFALRGILKNLPTIEERKEGRWVSMFDEDESKCSECQAEYYYPVTRGYNFCPNCGARMKGER